MDGRTVDNSPLSASLAHRVAWAFVALGIVLRLARYLLHFPLWGDEAMVAIHFLDHDFADLARPLGYHQVCPLLFLWCELAAVRLFGFSEWSLRLLPLLASLASLLVFRSLAARLLKGWPSAIAVAVFAVSYFIIRHGVEVKPYSGDLLVALVLFWLAVRWLEEPAKSWPLWIMAAVAPIGLALSLTAPFVACGLGLALLPTVWRQRRAAVTLAYLACAVSVLSAGALLYVLHLRPILAATGPAMINHHWVTAFPPLARPGAVPLWLLQMHCGRMLAYPLGGANFGSITTFLVCTVAVATLWRRREPRTIAMCLAPLGMGLLVAFLKRYPYGDSARTMQYVAPAVCLLAGIGVFALIGLFSKLRWQRRTLAIYFCILAAIGGAILLKDLVVPYKTRFDDVNRQFARWFWRDTANGAELVCAQRDLGLDVRTIGGQASAPEFFCNQRIYSAACGRGRSLDWRSVSTTHPLRVVLHCVEGETRNAASLAAWLHALQREHQLTLTAVNRFRLNVGQGETYGRLIEVFELVPRSELQVGQSTSPAPLSR